MLEPWVTVGVLGAPHGVRGWVKVHLNADSIPVEDIRSWYVAQKDHYEALPITHIKPHGKIWIAKLDNVDTPEKAALYTNRAIAIPRDQLPALKPGEYYWTDLIGLTVLDQQGCPQGVVESLLETGANDVLVIIQEKKEKLLIPYLPGKTVTSVDLAAHTIMVDWEFE